MITQRIHATPWIVAWTSSRLVRDADDLKSIPSDRIDQIRALNDDSPDGEGGGREERKDRDLDLVDDQSD